MTDRERLRIGDLKNELCEEQGFACACGCRAHVQADQCDLAHRVPETKRNLKQHGKAVIHHRLNLGAVPAGRLDCNKRVEIPRHEWPALIAKIREAQ